MVEQPEQFETSTKKVRGMARESLDLIDAMHVIVKAVQPVTGRGVGYKLFTAGLIPSMERGPMMYRVLLAARERGMIPWGWIVDEVRRQAR